MFLGLIILNTIALAADVPGAGGMRAHALHIINIVFIAFFTIEVVLKIIGMSMIEYMLNGFNVFGEPMIYGLCRILVRGLGGS